VTRLSAVPEPVITDAEHEYRRRIGRLLCAQRHYLGLSQQEVADVAGVTRNQVSALERAAQAPDAWRLSQIARALDTTIGWVLDEPDPASSKPRPIREAPIER
jgi:transcriptional regulator with XRE-family HTH domain